MPFSIHLGAVKKQMFWNQSRPQEQVPEVLPDDFRGTANQGLPVKQIPHLEFPKCIYKHPRVPFREVQHRNDNFELVGTEQIPTEHLTKVVNDEAELEAALADGWVKEPYIPETPAKSDADLYGPRKKK